MQLYLTIKKKETQSNFFLLTQVELQFQNASCTAAASIKEQTLNLLGRFPAPQFF